MSPVSNSHPSNPISRLSTTRRDQATVISNSFFRENAKALRFDALIDKKSYTHAQERANTAPKQHNTVE